MVRKSLRNFLFLFFFLSYSSPCWGQGTDVPGSQDHTFISRYARSVIIGYDVRDFDAYTMPLGRQVSDPKTGTPSAAKSQNLEGKITRILYVSPEGRSTLEVLRNYQHSLTKAGFEVLFTCAQAQCGDRLNMLLYPLERRLKNSGQISEYALEFPKDQRYLAAKASRPEGDLYVSLFVAICGINNSRKHLITLLPCLKLSKPSLWKPEK